MYTYGINVRTTQIVFHGGIQYAHRRKVSELEYTRRSLGPHGNVFTKISQISHGRATAIGVAASRRRNFLRFADWLPMESRAHMSSVPAVHCIATSRNRRSEACSASYGSIACGITTISEAFSGNGKVSTDQPPRLPWAGKKTGKNPTDRGKLGVKRSVLTDGRGVPLGVAIAREMRMTRNFFTPRSTVSLSAVPAPPRGVRSICAATRVLTPTLSAGKPADADTDRISSRAARNRSPNVSTAVARDAGWSSGSPLINHFCRTLIRWEKKAINFLALLHLAFAYTTWRQTLVLG